MPPSFGSADLPEFKARLAELRQTLGTPTEAGAYEANTDGACLGNPEGPGGWAAVVEHLGQAGRTWELWGHLSSTSNNRAEALGMLAAVLWVPPRSGLLIRSDSELTVRILSGAYKAKKNTDIWTEINASIAQREVQVQPTWVRGHAGDPGNERADALSVLGAVNGDPERFQQQRASSSSPRRAAAPKVPEQLNGLRPQGEWETEFLKSVADQLRRGRALSDKQQAVLERMRARSR
jgi:ribonuclease HI